MVADPRRVKELFVAVLDLPDAQARQAFLERECSDDAELRQRLEALLKAHENPALSTERATDREVVHKTMNDWLQDADLAGVRDEPWLAKLPADEREQWQRFWKEVRSLRDGTSAPRP